MITRRDNSIWACDVTRIVSNVIDDRVILKAVTPTGSLKL